MDVIERILTEYQEWPTLRLTTRQAARLWALEVTYCECLLNQLVSDGHLCVDARGQYAWRGQVSVPHACRALPRASEAVA
jgi:hypothetical protein